MEESSVNLLAAYYQEKYGKLAGSHLADSAKALEIALGGLPALCRHAGPIQALLTDLRDAAVAHGQGGVPDYVLID
jgi:hypothetical protein